MTGVVLPYVGPPPERRPRDGYTSGTESWSERFWYEHHVVWQCECGTEWVTERPVLTPDGPGHAGHGCRMTVVLGPMPPSREDET